MWKQKWKLEAEAPEAAIFHGSRSGSCKCEMNESGSSKKISEAEAAIFKKVGSGSTTCESGSDKNLLLPPLPLLRYLRQDFFFTNILDFNKVERKRKRLNWKREWVNFKK